MPTALKTSVSKECSTAPVPASLALSVPAAARACALSRATVYRLIRAGDIRPRKCGARTLILMSELQRFLNELPDAGEAKDVSR
ncbi:helix-turn-helix domain-containing protein [Bosea sp. PAMC 26642]|uniref:helix-turn-helix domain-containing protein n=1 Tax=Bosea sp. (strain PAMC 26642) TaxID=1792307 RepID=UPI0009EB11C7